MSLKLFFLFFIVSSSSFASSVAFTPFAPSVSFAKVPPKQAPDENLDIKVSVYSNHSHSEIRVKKNKTYQVVFDDKTWTGGLSEKNYLYLLKMAEPIFKHKSDSEKKCPRDRVLVTRYQDKKNENKESCFDGKSKISKDVLKYLQVLALL